MINPDGIKALLPHRYPMLLLDRVLEIDPGRRLRALKAVTCNEPWYRTMPDNAPEEDYAYPPTLLVESWCQAAVLTAWHQPHPGALSDMVLLLGSVTDTRFFDAVRPGDVVEHRVNLIRTFKDSVILDGDSRVGDTVVMEVGHVVIARRPARELPGPRTATASTEALR